MLFDPTRRWVNDGACRGEDPGLFLPDSGSYARPPSPFVQVVWDRAKRVCERCPVLVECRRDTLGEEWGVWGGLDEHQRFILRKKLPERVKRWPKEKRLAWGKELHALAEGGVIWTRIRHMTGFSDRLGEQLIQEWLEHLRSLHRPKPVAAEPAEREKRPFPAGIGKKHAWVRDGSVIRDAYYKGETSDGVWVRVQFRSSREATYKWIKREDVHQYHPQPKVIEAYIRRPDAQKGTAIA